ncbi:UNVERIFIED_CONTAM: hypothetical protein GTU68_002286 [Idotea baltica]|nr:hypothetical protein [Idotea baltica]
MLTTSQASGSGSIISGERILTNAHVVANSSFIQVQKQGDSRKYNAKVIFISHETDLAILSVDTVNFFKDSKMLEIGNLPDTLDPVRVYGFPVGGKTLSITKGVLSRVEHQGYAHSGGVFLAGQIDAAINIGNSGGPVIAEGKIVGVVMQANYSASSENLGYFVPPSIIKHVLKDSEDGINDGFRELGFFTQGMESPALKKLYGIEADQTGAVVNYLFTDSPAAEVMKVGDVILKINNFVVADDETINFRQDQRTSYKYAIDQFQLNEAIPITINRKGEELKIEIPIGKDIREPSLVRTERFGQLPEYYVYGGVLFVPLNTNLIKRWGSDWARKAPFEFLQKRYEWSTAEREEAVVALMVFPNDVNLGYHSWKNWVFNEVNGKPIKNFAQLSSMLHNNKEENIVISDGDGYKIVLNHEQAIKSRDEILQRYRIPNYHSKDLF